MIIINKLYSVLHIKINKEKDVLYLGKMPILI